MNNMSSMTQEFPFHFGSDQEHSIILGELTTEVHAKDNTPIATLVTMSNAESGQVYKPPFMLEVGMQDKPTYTIQQMITFAIVSSPSRRLALHDIYKSITESFPYYRHAPGGWKNSVRHNLSLNKTFIKEERSHNDPGKGCYWSIDPAFLERESKRPSRASEPLSSYGSQTRGQKVRTQRHRRAHSASRPTKRQGDINKTMPQSLTAAKIDLRGDIPVLSNFGTNHNSLLGISQHHHHHHHSTDMTNYSPYNTNISMYTTPIAPRLLAPMPGDLNDGYTNNTDHLMSQPQTTAAENLNGSNYTTMPSSYLPQNQVLEDIKQMYRGYQFDDIGSLASASNDSLSDIIGLGFNMDSKAQQPSQQLLYQQTGHLNDNGTIAGYSNPMEFTPHMFSMQPMIGQNNQGQNMYAQNTFTLGHNLFFNTSNLQTNRSGITGVVDQNGHFNEVMLLGNATNLMSATTIANNVPVSKVVSTQESKATTKPIAQPTTTATTVTTSPLMIENGLV